MRKIVYSVVIGTLLTAWPALAQQNGNDANADSQQAGTTTEETTQTSTTTTAGTEGNGLENQLISINPQLGFLNFRDASGETDDRGAIGLTFDYNASNMISRLTGMGPSPLFLGPSIGAFYSHIGATGTGFLGDATPSPSGPVPNAGYPGANLVMMPLDLKAAWNWGPVQVGAHAGGNVFYSSIADAVQLGVNPRTSTASNWTILPDVGADIEFGATNSITILARPDWTLGGSNRMLALTVGAIIPLG